MSHAFDAICETHKVYIGRGCPECNDQTSPHGATYIQCPGPPLCPTPPADAARTATTQGPA
jgi:hypothetical protein